MLKILFSFLILLSLTSCQTGAVSKPLPEAVKPPVESGNEALPDISLYWENTTSPRPERKTWSQTLIAGFNEDLELYSSASDVTEFCPKYKSLSRNDKLKALGEFMVALAYYESGFNPKTESVDVGKPNDKGSWSVGLYQMSANDNSAKQVGVTYEKLKDPHLNILVAMIQLKKQISLRGKFFLDNSDSMRYWAPTLRNNKYSKIPEIKARVLKHAPKCG